MDYITTVEGNFYRAVSIALHAGHVEFGDCDRDCHMTAIPLHQVKLISNKRPEEPPSKVEVEGTVTGDGECWCLEVDEATYRRIMGDKDADMVLDIHRDVVVEERRCGASEYSTMRWLLYHNDLIKAKGRVRLTIITEDLED